MLKDNSKKRHSVAEVNIWYHQAHRGIEKTLSSASRNSQCVSYLEGEKVMLVKSPSHWLIRLVTFALPLPPFFFWFDSTDLWPVKCIQGKDYHFSSNTFQNSALVSLTLCLSPILVCPDKWTLHTCSGVDLFVWHPKTSLQQGYA